MHRCLQGAVASRDSEEFFETCAMLITFICLGKYLECVAKGRTCAAIAALMGLAPPTAVLLGVDSDGKVLSEEDIPTSLVQRGDILKVCSRTACPALCRECANVVIRLATPFHRSDTTMSGLMALGL